ncbi:MAG: radical SAM protein [Planctomycetota bacterium]
MNALRYWPFVQRGIRRAGPPLHLTVFVTGRCNLRCRHCFHWKEVAEGVEGPSLASLQRLADSSARMGPLLWLSLGGGEPFLRRDLAEVARAFGRHGLRHLAIPTNGLVEDRQHDFIERVLAENPDLYLSVAVSFDGPPAVHDSIRQIAGGHARAMASVRALKEQQRRHERLGVGVLVCVTSENQDVLADHLEELVRELAPDNVTINLARGTALDPGLLKVDITRYEEVVARKERLMRDGKLAYFRFPMAAVAVARDRLMYEHVAAVARGTAGRAHLPCTAATLSAVIFESGEVHPCEILGRSMGNLNAVDWDLARLWSSPAAQELRRDIARTRCSCTWECAQADNVLFRPKSWPRLAWTALRS